MTFTPSDIAEAIKNPVDLLTKVIKAQEHQIAQLKASLALLQEENKQLKRKPDNER